MKDLSAWAGGTPFAPNQVVQSAERQEQTMRAIVEGGTDSQRGMTMVEVVAVLAISMVMAALTAGSMQSAVNTYQMNSTCRQLTALAQLARVQATARATRYRVLSNSTNGWYRLEYCSSSTGNVCNSWSLDAYSGQVTLPTGISFSAAGISAIPPDQTAVTLATDMTFNSMGMLYDTSAGALKKGGCFYLQASGNRPTAVCSTMAGKTTVFRLFGSNWETQ
jgi:Tfp pilus assembly protein FimT